MNKIEETIRTKFNFLKKFYDETWDKSGHTLHIGLFKNKKDTLNKAYKQATEYLVSTASDIKPFDKNSTVLDIGCGTGRTIIEICAKFDCQGTGIDLSDEQIKDAREYLEKLNEQRTKQGKKTINVKFVRGSGSELEKRFRKNEQFSHIISQDAILLVNNKQSLFENVFRLLKPGGTLAVADFLSESDKKNISNKEKGLIYKLVNWDKPLSFRTYKNILTTVGLNIIQSEKRNSDMVLTYQKLAEKMKRYISQKNSTYKLLHDRYEEIAASAKVDKMGWGLFFAQKPDKKTALIAGTNEKSIGRFLAKKLHKDGWEIWLYGRSAKRVDKPNWHERKCDISNEKNVVKLIEEIDNLDLALMLADAGHSHGDLAGLSEEGIKASTNAKLIGSILLTKTIEQKFKKQNHKIKLVWGAGKTSKKTKNLVHYGLTNSAIAAFVESLNEHYSNIFRAYYLPITLTTPSTLGDIFIKEYGQELKKIAKPPKVIAKKLEKILQNRVKPGMLNFPEDTL